LRADLGDACSGTYGLMNSNEHATMRIPYMLAHHTLAACLRQRGFSEPRALECARIFVDNTAVGVASHGLNRFTRFLRSIDRGWVHPDAVPQRIDGIGGFEQWDGKMGPGPLNAIACMDRAVELARQSGIGCVALRNTNHWMRAGTYVWRAANARYPAICFTNTEPNLPPWGGVTPKLGNNPIAIAIPRRNGRHILYDGALSQFSYGAMEDAARRGEELSVPGGFDEDGKMTRDPTAILASRRALPMGYWKGAGLALMLDLLAAVLSSGKSTRELGEQDAEYGVSQTFIAFLPHLVGDAILDEVEATLESLCDSDSPGEETVRYPGERLIRLREENLRLGVPVDASIWDVIQAEAPDA
jgi:3-dehydro-L-gulonate 2-dehydrogenase